jgi:hypothetical protein
MQLGFWRAASFVIIAATAASLGVADGLSDLSFGQSGVAKIAFPNSTDGGVQAAAMVNGHLIVAGFALEANNYIEALSDLPPLYISQVSLTGVPSDPLIIEQRAIQNPTGLVVRSDGNIFAAGTNVDPSGDWHATVVWFDSTGQVIATYQRPKSKLGNESWCLESNGKVLLDTRGNVLAACISARLDEFGDFAGQPFPQIVRLIPQNGALSLDSTFGTNGWQDIPIPAGYVIAASGAGGGFASVFEDRLSGNYYFAQNPGDFSPGTYLVRLDATTGAPDMTYGVNGFAMIPTKEAEAFATDGSGRVIVAGITYFGSTPSCCHDADGSLVARFNSDGSVDSTFGNGGLVMAPWLGPIVDALADANGRIYLQASQLWRLRVDGSRDGDFSSSSDVQSVNGAGSTWASMLFSDSTHSAIFLLGGAFAAKSATTGVIQKITLAGGAPVVATQTTLSATANQTALTLSATVTGNTPTGGVTFFDGTGVIGTAPLVNGVTALSVAANAGSYNITAYYGGDSANGFSNSSVVPITVAVTTAGQAGTSDVGAIHVSGGGAVSAWEIAALVLLTLVGRIGISANAEAFHGSRAFQKQMLYLSIDDFVIAAVWRRRMFSIFRAGSTIS